MKQAYILFFSVIISATFLGCNTETPELGTPFSSIEGISDEWELVEMYHSGIDITTDDILTNTVRLPATYVGNVPTTLNFTNDFNFTGNANSSKVFFPTSGQWAFDDDDYPSKLFITSGGETIELKLLAPVRENVDQFLHFLYIRPFGDCSPSDAVSTGTVGYEYKFARR